MENSRANLTSGEGGQMREKKGKQAEEGREVAEEGAVQASCRSKTGDFGRSVRRDSTDVEGVEEGGVSEVLCSNLLLVPDALPLLNEKTNQIPHAERREEKEERYVLVRCGFCGGWGDSG